MRKLWIFEFVFFTGSSLISGCAVSNPEVSKSAEARQRFNTYCVTAGEKILRTVENVDGFFVMKLRSEKSNFHDQFLMDDPYGSDLHGEGYLHAFLKDFHAIKRTAISARAVPLNWNRPVGYRFVEAIDLKDGHRYRYTGHVEEPWINNKHYLKGYVRFVLDASRTEGPMPRYGVTYDDISTQSDRALWIAGSSLRVIDLETGAVMAERVGYMYDPAQGSTIGGRAPWLMAASHACPAFGKEHAFSAQSKQAVIFVEKVLHLKIDK